jgi:cell division topological specificity factor
MLQWFQRFFGAPTSSDVARERLRLVLLSDHLALSPDVVEALRRDLFEVISRYVEVDEANSDVSFEHKEQGIAMLANIPIISMKDRPSPPPPPPRQAEEETSVLEAVSSNGHISDNYGARPPRRKRKRKTSAAANPAPAQ